MLGILRGLLALHDRGVAHRDVKLDNVLMARPNCLTELRLADLEAATELPGQAQLSRWEFDLIKIVILVVAIISYSE